MIGVVGKWKFWMIFLSGLDPAKPLWYTNLTSALTYINKDDAQVNFNKKINFFSIKLFYQLVDIIHTNAGVLGAVISVGNCDFWPNGGISQPGCSTYASDPLCDHARSWYYYAESVEEERPSFDAIQCSSYSDFKHLNCIESTSITYMGFHAPMECSGEYYLQTNSKSPFSRGVFGLQYYPAIDTDRLVGNEEN